MKLAKAQELTIQDDPKPMDRATWQRLRVAAEHEAVHRDWGCALYTLHRSGRITSEQREAGDKYASLVRDQRKLWADKMGMIEVYRPGETSYEKRSRATNDIVMVMGHIVADCL